MAEWYFCFSLLGSFEKLLNSLISNFIKIDQRFILNTLIAFLFFVCALGRCPFTSVIYFTIRFVTVAYPAKM